MQIAADQMETIERNGRIMDENINNVIRCLFEALINSSKEISSLKFIYDFDTITAKQLLDLGFLIRRYKFLIN